MGACNCKHAKETYFTFYYFILQGSGSYLVQMKIAILITCTDSFNIFSLYLKEYDDNTHVVRIYLVPICFQCSQ